VAKGGWQPPGERVAAKREQPEVGVQEGVVVLSVGKDDNVEIGYEFTIYDGDRFIGKVQVTKVLDDMSGCTILFQEGSGIREGHKASTRLSG
jgi:hypothetical protein